MKGILPDINIQGQAMILLLVWQSREWREVWESLGLSVHTFGEFGWNATAADNVIWRECQKRGLVLLTANRNQDGPTSLETTIREELAANSLPVFTIADPQRVQREASYAARTAVKLLQYFTDIDTVRGVGRLYVP